MFAINNIYANRRFSLAKTPTTITITILSLIYINFGGPATAQTCPLHPSPAINSSAVPTDVCIPSGFSENPIEYFDDYSWRAFIALVWPAQNGQRGVPDAINGVGVTSGPLVFETFKADWEVFQPAGKAPSSWGTFGGVSINPCQSDVPDPGFHDLLLASLSKFANLGEAGFGKLVGPLVAQNSTYVRYLMSFNRTEFDKVLNSKWYIRDDLKGDVTFDNGSVDIKTSWVDMKNIVHPERFYTRKAWLKDPATDRCTLTTVGLVGMHIVQKTPTRPQWIWSSFEHIDNVPQADPSNLGSLVFNNGDSHSPMPDGNPVGFPPPATPPPPFNVERVKPVHESTQKTNLAYRKALQGTIWENYQLVMTQWPLQPSRPEISGGPANTFPGVSSQSTNFANTTMETFDQKSPVTGCMACHNLTKSKTDFLWALEINAFPPPSTTLVVSSPATANLRTLNASSSSDTIQQLKELMQSIGDQQK
jgi:hypothetical protein